MELYPRSSELVLSFWAYRVRVETATAAMYWIHHFSGVISHTLSAHNVTMVGFVECGSPSPSAALSQVDAVNFYYRAPSLTSHFNLVSCPSSHCCRHSAFLVSQAGYIGTFWAHSSLTVISSDPALQIVPLIPLRSELDVEPHGHFPSSMVDILSW